MYSTETVEVRAGDLDTDFYRAAMAEPAIAWDIETTGLDWARDQIGTCQIATPERIVVVQLRPGEHPRHLMSLLETPDLCKVFHHAPFDLRFMMTQWQAEPRNIACTKVASKVLDPQRANGEHSLKPVLARTLGLHIDKDEQTSNWATANLTVSQLRYASTDVAHLLALVEELRSRCRERGLERLLLDSWSYLPTRVQLELNGLGDVFAY